MRDYILCAIIIVCMLSACTVGPDFHKPAPPTVKTYTSTNIESSTKSANCHLCGTQTFAAGGQVPAKWWELFKSQQLNALVIEGLKNNPNITALKATLNQARENFNAQNGSSLPQVDLNASVIPTRFAPAVYGFGNFPPTDFVVYNASLSVSYNLDIFGGLRRQNEGYAALAEYQVYELSAAQLTLISNISTSTFKAAALNDQIQTTNKIIQIQEQMLAIANKQAAIGSIDNKTVLAIENNLSQTKATMPGLQNSLSIIKNQLAIYIGRAPGEINLPDFSLSNFNLPQQLPISVPSKLTEQRPDIMASIALLHKASADVGVATANQYPQFNITASGGPIATQNSWGALTGNTAIWSFGPALTQPLFHGGTLSAQKRAAIAAYDSAFAAYKQTVLHGLQEVADSLKALDADAKLLEQQQAICDKNKNILTITQNQYKSGAASLNQVLNDQITYNQSLINLLLTQSTRLADTAALFQALGGSWW